MDRKAAIPVGAEVASNLDRPKRPYRSTMMVDELVGMGSSSIALECVILGAIKDS